MVLCCPTVTLSHHELELRSRPVSTLDFCMHARLGTARPTVNMKLDFPRGPLLLLLAPPTPCLEQEHYTIGQPVADGSLNRTWSPY